MDRIKLLAAEIFAGSIILLVLYGLYAGIIGSFLSIPEATGVYLILFFIMLAFIDIFLIVYTLAGWEHE